MSASTTWTPRPTGSGVSAEPCTSRRPTATSAAFRSSPTRKRRRLALVKGLKPGQQQPAELGKPGRVGWHELLAADWQKAFAFYGELFGWQKAGADIGLDGHVSVVLHRRADDRRHVHQTSVGAGSVLALLLQCRRHRRGRGAREDRLAARSSRARLKCRAAAGSPDAGTLRAPRSRCREARSRGSAVGWSAEWGGFSSKGRLVTEPRALGRTSISLTPSACLTATSASGRN